MALNVVKNNKNRYLNRDINDLKFYKFKQLLKHVCRKAGKQEYFVKEHYTTQSCSSCGTLNKKIGKKEIFVCTNTECNLVCGRDCNAAKNIAMKGITTFV